MAVIEILSGFRVPHEYRAAWKSSADGGCIFYANETLGTMRRIPLSELGIADLLRIFVLPSSGTMPERVIFLRERE